MFFVPFMSGEGVSFPPHVGFDLASKLVRHATAGSLHSTGGFEIKSRAVCVERIKLPREDINGNMMLKPLHLCY